MFLNVSYIYFNFALNSQFLLTFCSVCLCVYVMLGGCSSSGQLEEAHPVVNFAFVSHFTISVLLEPSQGRFLAQRSEFKSDPQYSLYSVSHCFLYVTISLRFMILCGHVRDTTW